MTAQAAGSQMREERKQLPELCKALPWFPAERQDGLSHRTEEFLASCCFINLAFLLRFQWGGGGGGGRISFPLLLLLNLILFLVLAS